jgi:hypothetical protein
MSDHLPEDEWRLIMESKLFALQTALVRFVAVAGQSNALAGQLTETIANAEATTSGSAFEEMIVRALEDIRAELEEVSED